MMVTLENGSQNLEAGESGTWMSVGDLMSALLMIFALLLISALAQITEVTENRENSRVIIIKGINDALQAAEINIQANPVTGDISITDSVLFERNEFQLKETGKDFLNKFIPIYSDVIFTSPGAGDEVVRVVLEGHSSSEGDFNHNMRLSILRANSVFSFISLMEFEYKEYFLDKLLVSGRGAIDSNKEFADDADRKVLFRFQFKGLELHELDNQATLSRLTHD